MSQPADSSFPTQDLTRDERLARLRAAQQQDWQAGSRVLVEAYLAEQPTLQSDDEALLELLHHEIALRQQFGETPQIEEYVQRFPRYETQLRDRLAITVSDVDGIRTAVGARPSGVTQDAIPPPPVPRAGEPNQADWPTIPGYEILGELGRGGMGVVYRARQKGLGRLVALKMIRDHAFARPEALSRFRAEALTLGSLHHPNIVQIYEVGEHEGRPFFSFELVPGGSLEKHLRGSPQPAGDAARLLETLARAVHAAHERGIVHRDLKPANILLTFGREPPASAASALAGGSRLNEGVPKITDFGLAKQLDEEETQTRTGAIMGSPPYMAPEQASGKSKEVGPACDVYALGAILYELLTGRPPFKAASILETLDLVRHQEPLPPGRLQPNLPRDLETIAVKCLQKDPRQRYPSALALADDLRRFLDGEPIVARPVSRWERAAKWARRRPTLAALVGASGVAVVSLVVLAVVLTVLHGTRLQAERDQARADEYAARIEAQEAKDRQQRAVLRAEVQALLLRGRSALDQGRAREAQLELVRAKERVGGRSELEDLRAEVDRRLAEANRRLTSEADAQRARETYARFKRLRDDALFHATLFNGLDLATNRAQTRTAAAEALALFGVRPQTESPPGVDHPAYDPAQRREITEACYELLLVLADARDTEPALRLLDRASRLGPPTRAWHLQRARYLTRLGKPDDAARALRQGLAVQPTTAVDYFLLGVEANQGGNPAQAALHFQNALRCRPDHYWSEYYLAVCYLRLQEPAMARASLTACIGRRPDFLWTYLMRGFAYGEMAHEARAHNRPAEAEFLFDAAEADYREVLRREPNDTARYGAYVNRGVLAFRRGQMDRAVAELKQAIRLQPAQFQAYVNLAQVYQALNRLDDALAQLNEAVRREPRNAPLYRTRSQVLLTCGDFPAALRDIDEAIRLQPGDGLADDQVQRGRILFRSGRYGHALRASAAAMTLRPDDAEAQRLRAEALFQLGEAETEPAKKRGRYEEAIRSFEMYLKKGKPLPEVYRTRALARARLGQTEAAIDDYTLALALKPDAASHTARGWAYIVNDSLRLARHDFEEALRLEPDHADAHAGRGFARVLLGDYRAAVTDAEEAVRLDQRAPRTLYKAARVYAAAVGKIDTERGRSSEEVLALRATYQDRALALMRESLERLRPEQRGTFWQAYVRTDPTLLPLRRSAGFKKLEAEVMRSANER